MRSQVDMPGAEGQQNSFRVLFYGINASQPSFIMINIDEGIPPPHSPDDLALGDKIIQGSSSACVINPKNKTFTCFPDPYTLVLHYPFTFISDHPSLAAPNNCIQKICKRPFLGNLLVVKSTPDMKLMHIKDDDLNIVNSLLSSALRCKEL
ncbi:hypothetical protein BJ138DRAFT_1118275 [Hygrophoropsis aurantiaca]|uniref:Uncharacterized protein n=1 Tax=Hygrophoropsis aurantiaca TaxID=72124 RepID=A0ACB7ZXQ4_9AGAM|nr:hypothetical protein BJ138DRAFT_1118275 [Hygrophoropsis aurantiaca]